MRFGHTTTWASAALVLLSGDCLAQLTERDSVGPGGVEGNQQSSFPSFSADGRFVAFISQATNWIPGLIGYNAAFVHDRATGNIELVSPALGGAPPNWDSTFVSISADGRVVAFMSAASNLVLGDTNNLVDVFAYDRTTGLTDLVSVSSTGVQGNGFSYHPTVSADGRYVAFKSDASNLVLNDTNNNPDVFLRDRLAGTTELISMSSTGVQGSSTSQYPSMSSDGRWIAFESDASNLVAGDSNGTTDVFVRDRLAGTTELVSIAVGGAMGNADSHNPAISADGRFVAFMSYASNLVAVDNNGNPDIFVRDRQTGVTELVSISSSGAQGDLSSGTGGNLENVHSAISVDGRFVAFQSQATNLVQGDTNGYWDVFVRDRYASITERVSVSSSGVQGDHNSGYDQLSLSMSSDGRYVAFGSEATTLVSGDTNLAADVFVRDRHMSGFTSSCDPGLGGVVGCPCSNPASGLGRGCDNSSNSGGASLSATGIAYLSTDSLVFTTSAERPTATSILLQGTAEASSGVVYGQGVRCVAGTLKRLFVKTAVAGSIVAPDFGIGDPTVSARSAAKGDVIQPGQSRWYLVYYRDPVVLGGCPAGSTFNATQTGRIDWSL